MLKKRKNVTRVKIKYFEIETCTLSIRQAYNSESKRFAAFDVGKKSGLS